LENKAACPLEGGLVLPLVSEHSLHLSFFCSLSGVHCRI
jgi:hypothetical protein